MQHEQTSWNMKQLFWATDINARYMCQQIRPWISIHGLETVMGTVRLVPEDTRLHDKASSLMSKA